jgi:hypothetical protein
MLTYAYLTYADVCGSDVCRRMRISQDAVAAAEQSDDDLCIYILNEHLARMLMVRCARNVASGHIHQRLKAAYIVVYEGAALEM